MIKLLRDLFANKDIRGRILFTLGIFFIYRLGAAIPAPMVNTDALLAGIGDDSFFGMVNLLGGGALQEFSIFAMGIGPYITSSIIIPIIIIKILSISRIMYLLVEIAVRNPIIIAGRCSCI